MLQQGRNRPPRLLDPIERLSEILFGLVMALTFTGSLSVADAGRDDVRAMLIGALGCNLAWGVIDGVFYLMGRLAEMSHGLMTYRAVREADDAEDARHLIADALPSVLTTIMQPAELDSIRSRLKAMPEPPLQARLRKDDFKAALGVCLLVFFSTFPIVLPFMFMDTVQGAMRVSNAIAITMLFLTGFAFGRVTGRHPWLMGLAMVLLGGILVAITIALGG